MKFNQQLAAYERLQEIDRSRLEEDQEDMEDVAAEGFGLTNREKGEGDDY